MKKGRLGSARRDKTGLEKIFHSERSEESLEFGAWIF